MEEIEMASHVQFDDAAIRPISSIKRDVTARGAPASYTENRGIVRHPREWDGGDPTR